MPPEPTPLRQGQESPAERYMRLRRETDTAIRAITAGLAADLQETANRCAVAVTMPDLPQEIRREISSLAHQMRLVAQMIQAKA